MDPQVLKERYKKLLEDYHSGAVDWKTFESGLFELKRARAALASAGEELDALPDTRTLEKLRREERRESPNRFTNQETGFASGSSVTHRRDSGTSLSMSTVPASSFRAEPSLPAGEASGIRMDSRILKSNAPTLQVGNLLGERYTLQRSLGIGNFGETWRAKDSETGNHVVIKRLPIPIQRESRLAGKFFDAFRRVAAISHPNICPVYYLDEDDKHGMFVVSACLDAIPLDAYHAQYLHTFRSFPASAAARVLWPVATALDFLYERKIFHRDLKPNNVLIGKSCGVLLTDAWLAEFVRTALSELGISSDASDGAPWRAPEVWQDSRYGMLSDQFSLAVLAYQLLADRLPFGGQNEKELREKILNSDPAPIESESETVNDALRQALSKDPFERFPSCLHFVKALIEPTTGGPHYSRSRVQNARPTLWALLFGIPKPERPACLSAEAEQELWPFGSTETPVDVPDLQVPQRSVYPYQGTPMNPAAASATSSLFSSTTALLLGGLSVVALGTGIAVSTLAKPTVKDEPSVVRQTESPVPPSTPANADSSNSVAKNEASPSNADVNVSEAAGDKEETEQVSADDLVRLTEEASTGNIVAQRKLGELYFHGRGVSTNHGTAIRYFRASADKGDAMSLYYLGRCSELGLGVPVDTELAKKYYTRAAKQGYREARLALRNLNEKFP